MRILAIESSCDETSAAVVEKEHEKISVLSESTATSLQIHSMTGGIIPENAARMQLQYILPVIYQTLLQMDKGTADSKKLNITISEENIQKANQVLLRDIDEIAVTYGPGLIGSLLVGVETAKTLAYVFQKKIIPVNHLLAHVYANYIQTPDVEIPPSNIPFIGLVISGGHTDLLHFPIDQPFKWLGGTRDDAAGEAFDKIGRILNLAYPAGPAIEKNASRINKPAIKFKSPIINEDNYDFSFSGLKSEAMRYISREKIGIYSDTQNPQKDSSYQQKVNEVCYATQKAIFDVVIKKTLKAAQELNCNTILVGGGVSANQTLRSEFERHSEKLGIRTYFPPKMYSTDNAAMIGAYAAMNPYAKEWKQIIADPELYFD